MSKLQKLILLAGLAGITWPALAGDVVHKWVDEKGRVHFSDHPPTVTNTETKYIDNPSSGDAAQRANQKGINELVKDIDKSYAEKRSRAKRTFDSSSPQRSSKVSKISGPKVSRTKVSRTKVTRTKINKTKVNKTKVNRYGRD